MITISFYGTVSGAIVLTWVERLFHGENVSLYNTGLSSHGALLGLIASLWIFAKVAKKRAKDVLYTFFPVVPLMYAIGKYGCLCAGCCHGIEYSGPGSIVYLHSQVAAKGVSYFPIQMVESFVFLIIFILIKSRISVKGYTDQLCGKEFLLCGLAKYLLEFLRFSHQGKGVTASFTQTISIFFVVIGIYLLYSDETDPHQSICLNCKTIVDEELNFCYTCGKNLKETREKYLRIESVFFICLISFAILAYFYFYFAYNR